MTDTDEREALAELVHSALRRDDFGVANDDERDEVLGVADAILAAGFRREGWKMIDLDDGSSLWIHEESYAQGWRDGMEEGSA